MQPYPCHKPSSADTEKGPMVHTQAQRVCARSRDPGQSPSERNYAGKSATWQDKTKDEGGRNGEQEPKAYWALGQSSPIRAHASTAWTGRARYHADDFSSRTLPATTFVLTVGARTAARDLTEPGGKGVATGHGASAVARAALAKLLLLGDLACPRRRCT